MTRIQELYRRFRKANSTWWSAYRHHSMFNQDIGDAKRCIRNARLIAAFEELESDEDEPDTDSIGVCRIRTEVDECHDWQDELECWLDTGKPMTEQQEAHARERFEEVSRDGAFGTIGEVWDGHEWQEVASCWGHVGYDDPADPFENEYVLDHMAECLKRSKELREELESAELAWTIDG